VAAQLAASQERHSSMTLLSFKSFYGFVSQAPLSTTVGVFHWNKLCQREHEVETPRQEALNSPTQANKADELTQRLENIHVWLIWNFRNPIFSK
jgi:hypothetical protein